MKRGLLNLLTVVSLPLCVGLFAVWVLSIRLISGSGPGIDMWRPSTTGMVHDRAAIVVIPGCLQFQNKREVYQGSSPNGAPEASFTARLVTMGTERGGWWYYQGYHGPGPTPSPLERLGFDRGGDHLSEANRTFYCSWATAPTWLFVALFAVLPALRLRTALARRSRLRPGLCPSCGYDLRATPERCPECGAQTGTASVSDAES